MEQLIEATRAYVKKYMAVYDPSHDYTHILRVVHQAHAIEASERTLHPEVKLDSTIITLSSMLHDVGDRKYVTDGEDPATLVRDFLVEQNANRELAEKVQTICTNVSYTNETKHPEAVAKLCKEIPELAIVQDADRLDSIGATGIARLFAFSGAKVQVRGLSVDHFEEKLLALEGIMKTDLGKKMAKERTDRLKTFLGWWGDETDSVEGLTEEMDLKRKAEQKVWGQFDQKKTNGDVTKLGANLEAET
jgi:uncharacterized protein